MDVKEIKFKKEKLTIEIADLLNNFTEETGVTITDLRCEAIGTITEEVKYYLVNLEVKI